MEVKTIRFKREPKKCICPFCGMKQKFKSNGSYFKVVKDISVEFSIRLKVEVLRAKCFNSSCRAKSFAIFPKGIEKYSRATQRLKQEAICGLINDNSTTLRISKRFERIFNTTGSKSSIDRWKHKEADKLDTKEIIQGLTSPVSSVWMNINLKDTKAMI